MEKESVTNEELVELIKGGFDHVAEEFTSLRTEFKSEIHDLRVELKSEISDLRIGMNEGFMKTNDKVDLLTEKLVDKKVITKKDAEEVMSLGPVPIS